MTSPDPPDSISLFAAHDALFNDVWTSFDQVRLPISDLGFRQGVTVVERLRTYHGRPFEVDRHADRWLQSLADLKLSCIIGECQFREVIAQLLQRNPKLLGDVDGRVGITLFATPDSWAAHLNPIDDLQVDRRQIDGQPLVVTDYQSPPNRSWSRQAKVRSRIHFYLADLSARSLDTQAIGLLVDRDETEISVTETSVANLAIVEKGEIVSPCPEQVLPGVTQQVAKELAKTLDISWRQEPISLSRLRTAEEVLLLGTDTGIWFANRVSIPDFTPSLSNKRERGRVCLALQAAFQDHIQSQA